jgi:hypothetical protein
MLRLSKEDLKYDLIIQGLATNPRGFNLDEPCRGHAMMYRKIFLSFYPETLYNPYKVSDIQGKIR